MRGIRLAWRRAAALAGAVAMVAGTATACSSSAAKENTPTTLRVGYFPNLTHAPAIVGVQKGIFARDLGSRVTLKTATFNAGPDEVQALFSGAIDVAFLGPGPTVNAYQKSVGKALRVISGATSGGAALVVKKSITSVGQLRGAKLATPQKGNTQDVALRYFLARHGFKTDLEGGGDVSIVPQDNATTLTSFASHAIDGAWVPEPYATRLVGEGAHVLVDERSLWPGGRFVTTNVVVRSDYLKAHPDVVRGFVRGVADAVEYTTAHPADAQQTVNAALASLTGKSLKPGALRTAWSHLTFTVDPLAATLRAGAEHAKTVGLLDSVHLDGLYDLGRLNAVLTSRGQPAVTP